MFLSSNWWINTVAMGQRGITHWCKIRWISRLLILSRKTTIQWQQYCTDFKFSFILLSLIIFYPMALLLLKTGSLAGLVNLMQRTRFFSMLCPSTNSQPSSSLKLSTGADDTLSKTLSTDDAPNNRRMHKSTKIQTCSFQQQ